YLNIASFSPAFKSVETAGITAVKRKRRPDYIEASDLFDPVIELRTLFSQVIDAEDYNRVVTIPSVSYGLANVANNISLKKGDEIILIEEQFPSNVYIWETLATKYEAKILTIKRPDNAIHWNSKILEAITEKTAVVAMAHVHWANGFIFDLKAIRHKTNTHKALLIIDGSQSIGAMPFSVRDLQPDALICAGYKWLFGPYGCAYAYYSAYFDNGEPIEQNWSTRLGSENLAGLTQYQAEYKPLAQRYAAGESASFIYVKMQIAALKEILTINPEDLQQYCMSISQASLEKLKLLDFHSDAPELSAKHLFGIKIPEGLNVDKLKQGLKDANIVVSFRGDYIRISSHLYNTEKDFDTLYLTIKNSM
ncbi:MAG: aminotransferase class V-fold PLP-dependent enzyme, partial [Winogradskyella sp.]|nr:aminotransferase class V-fold PLP-dependent enzyme [Winogradskyella sp.]